MLPVKVLQMDYQDFGNLVWDHFELIENFQLEKKIKFDGVIAKLRNGTIPGSIISNHFSIPMGVLNAPRKTNFENYELFLPLELRAKSQNSELNLLYVDAICGTGETLSEVKRFFNTNYSNINLHTYSTLVDTKANNKPDISGILHTSYFQPPWEWRSFTPQTHLDRLLSNNIKASDETSYALGFSSNDCKSVFEQSLGKKLHGEWIEIFDNEGIERKILSTSGISSIDLPKDGLTIELCKTRFSPLIDEKVKFITSNGLTHFIEKDWAQSLIISEKTPTCHVLFFDGKNLIKIYGKTLDKKKIISLNF